jgi:hypothetical protein
LTFAITVYLSLGTGASCARAAGCAGSARPARRTGCARTHGA